MGSLVNQDFPIFKTMQEMGIEGQAVSESTEKRRVSAHRLGCNPVCNLNIILYDNCIGVAQWSQCYYNTGREKLWGGNKSMKKGTTKKIIGLFLAMVMLVGALAIEPSTVTAATKSSITLNQTENTI